MVLFRPKLLSKTGRSTTAFKWKFEVAKMALYIYFPIFVWYGFNCDYGQKYFALPYCKKYNPDLYRRLTGEDLKDEDEQS